jgi:hypothetical protein
VEYLEANGYDPSSEEFSFQIIYPNRPDVPIPPGELVIDSVSDSIDSPADCAAITYSGIHSDIHLEVQVSATQQVPVIFMHLLGFNTIHVNAPSTAERSDRYDIVLILDRSGSMKFDTCSLLRPEDEYGCQNRYKPCTAFYSEGFDSYSTLGQVESAGWVILGNEASPFNVKLKKPGDISIELMCKALGDLEDSDPYSYDFACIDDTVSANIKNYTNVLLDNCTVNGNVEVKGGHLDVLNTSTITGNINVEDSYLHVDDSAVVGNVEVKIGSEDDVGFRITDNDIGGNVKVNEGGRLSITGNQIDGDLEAKCPTIVVEEDDNTVSGNEEICDDPLPPDICGAIYRTISSENYEDVALFFTADDVNLDSGDALQVFWRPSTSVGWSQIAEYSEADLPDGVESLLGVMLPSAAYDNPDLQIRFEIAGHTPKRLGIDEVELRVCPDTPGPWVWYEGDNDTGCRTDRPMTCESDDWDTLVPGVSISGDEPPLANLMEQPMLDTLLASATFIDIVDTRRPPGAPRGDQIGLVGYDSEADKLIDLTTDYEAIKEELFTSFRAWGGTNLGGGIRVGLSILGDGRWNSTHYMVLLTDGWPNFYDTPYTNPTTFGLRCMKGSSYTNDPCLESLVYIDTQVAKALEQNVTIFTIGLGEDLNTTTFPVEGVPDWVDGNYSGMDLLERIAEGTNGLAYHAPTTAELEEIFAWIAEAIFLRITR